MDELYQFVIEKAVQMLNPKQIWLFGSRARGDFRPRSDVDFAFEFDDLSNSAYWPEFCAELDDSVPTLLHLDLINLNQANLLLKKNILAHGKVIYKR